MCNSLVARCRAVALLAHPEYAMPQTTDRIEKEIVLNAPLARVWRALADPTEFGTWFGIRLTGEFTEGASLHGQITNPGCEHMECTLQIVSVKPEHLFAYRWAPCPEKETAEITTLVEFTLEQHDQGTKVTVVESGFDQLPADKRSETFLRNEGGWTQQLKNIEDYVAK